MNRLSLIPALIVTLVSSVQGQGRGVAAAPRALRMIDSVRVVETDTLFLAQPTQIAVGRGGQVYVSEANEGRVLEIAPSGRIARVFGRKGRGPGELSSPSTLAIGADSLLLVWDRGERRMTVFDLHSGTYVRSIPFALAWPPAMRVVGSEFWLSSYDWDAKTSLVRLNAAGEAVGREGVLPAIGLKHPVLMQGAFAVAVFAVSGDDVFAMFEVSPSAYHWSRGSRTAQEINVPALRRHGVKAESFEQMLRDPANQEANRALVFSRSVPVALTLVAPSTLGVVTMDYFMDKTTQTVVYYLTLLDIRRNRACVDVPVPSTQEAVSRRDPLPRVALTGDTLVILQQGVDAQGQSAASLRRFRIDLPGCSWTALQR